MIKYTVISFFDENKEMVGRYKSIDEVTDEKIEMLLKGHNASHATIEHKARLVKELNIKIA